MAGNYIREVVKDEPVEIDVGYHQAGRTVRCEPHSSSRIMVEDVDLFNHNHNQIQKFTMFFLIFLKQSI